MPAETEELMNMITSRSVKLYGHRPAAVLLSLSFLPAGAAMALAVDAPADTDLRPYIIGGDDTPQGKYPFVVSINEEYLDGRTFGHFCGGSLVSPSLVLTAAHCVNDLIDPADEDFRDPAKVVIVVNRADQRNRRVGEQRRVLQTSGTASGYAVVVHPKYDPETYSHDVAIIALDRPVLTVEPVALATPDSDVLERPGSLLTVAGWGNTSSSAVPRLPTIMQSVKVPVVSRWECQFAYPAGWDDSMMCAGVGGRDACQGDSGGPLFAELPDRRGFVQAGVVSYGTGCGKRGFPGGYARISEREINDFVTFFTGD